MNNIIIHDVGMRDGLQMESELIHSITKEMLISWLIESGIEIIQLGSFVNPKKVMQMQDTDELFEVFMQTGKKPSSTTLSALVLNGKGLERGLKVGVEMFCMGVSASETHSMKNTGKTTEDALKEILSIADTAIAEGRKVQVSVQSGFGCGFESDIPEEKVFTIVEKYLDHGLKNISLADTAGHADPAKVERMFRKLFDLDKDINPACHFHNTYGMGLTNIYVALQNGVRQIETAFGGLGGCPFTKSPSGNVPTEDFVHMLQRMGYKTNIKLEPIIKAANHMANFLVRDLPGQVYKTGGLNY